MIIFDLDGTLIDSSEGIVMVVTFVLEKLELQIKNGMCGKYVMAGSAVI